MGEMLNIQFVGLSEEDRTQFIDILQHSTKRSIAYQMGEPADIIITTNTASVCQGITDLDEGNDPLYICIGSADVGDSAVPTLTPPYLTNRVLRTLDKVAARSTKLGGRTKTVPTAPSPDRNYRVLVVDDSLAMRESLRIELESLNPDMEIEYCADGQTAIDSARANKYDIILLDIMLPEFSGHEVCQVIREDTCNHRTPVIMISGRTSPIDEVKGIMSGGTTYLTKPVEHKNFVDVMTRVMTWISENQSVQS